MNISMRDKKLLLMFSGVSVFGLGWFFGYRPQMEEAANIERNRTCSEYRKLSWHADFKCRNCDKRVCSFH